MFETRLLEAAVDDLAGIDREAVRRILKRLAWFATNFESMTPMPLSGPWSGLFKLRIGDYRALYEVVPGERAIIVHAIGHRSRIYRTAAANDAARVVWSARSRPDAVEP